MFNFPRGQRLEPILRREVGRLRRMGELLGLLVRERRLRQPRCVRSPAAQPLICRKAPVASE
jgi:hypothetical protein